MNFHSHSNLKDQHAFLGASKYHWINYDDEKLISSYKKYQATIRGTVMHDLACRLISLGVRLPKSKKTFNMYVNDAIGFKMQPEQVLYFSDNCFGTADAISFKNNFLRIHDYKSGITPVHMDQLYIYAALFCLEYVVKPENIKIELRIYKQGEVLCEEPDPEVIRAIMNKIVDSDKFLRKLKEEER